MTNTTTNKPFGIVIHGGAGTIKQSDPKLEAKIINDLEAIVNNAKSALENGASAIDVVETAVRALEDNPFFNAGKGAVYTNQGEHELDASIMDGQTLQSGAICGVRYSPNPITLARAVMEQSEHVFLGGLGAEAFAREKGLPEVGCDYFDTETRYQQYLVAKENNQFALESSEDAKDNKFGTVGAVALDMNGHLAAATSTGGITNKLYGRIGDSPVIGAGTYANDATCAVSATGYGEAFIRKVVAHDIHARMLYSGVSLAQAADAVVMQELPKINGDGGIIAIDKDGNITMPFNTKGMYRAFATANSAAKAFIFKDEN